MDAIDGEILGVLTQSARESFSEIGRRVGLSANATAARVRRMEQEGTILGYSAITGSDARVPLGQLEVFVDVRLDVNTDYDTFVSAITPIREVADAVHMTGPYDYLLHVYVADAAALDALLRRLKKSCGAAQTQTRVALRIPKQSTR